MPPDQLRVLFVDDEQDLLAGLRLSLRPQARRWEMRFTHRTEEALEWLAEWPADVIVSDVRMPGLDGPTFLDRTRRVVPHAMRIILSGQADEALSVRGTAVSHQWLVKPCERAVLVGTIERAASVRELSQDQRVLRALGGASSLPAMPEAYARLRGAIADPEVAVKDVTAIVAADPAIAARLLQLANSSFYGGGQTDLDLGRAVMRVGLKTLAELVLSSEVFETLRASSVPQGFSPAAFQLHGRMVAELASRFAASAESRAHALCAGLLHEVGVLLLMRHVPEGFERAWCSSLTAHRPLHESEREILGVTHAEVGGALLAVWGLPLDVVTAVAWHHEPWKAAGRGAGADVLNCVALADACADAALGEEQRDPWPRAGALDRQWLAEHADEARLEGRLLEARALLRDWRAAAARDVA